VTVARAAPVAPPVRVLLAEDEVHLGTILQQFLIGRGFEVTVVRDGQQAIDRLLGEAYDVALLDIVMPEVDGLEVLRRVRETADPPEMIVITGNGSVETAITALKLGAYDYLAKPYRMAEIEALVRRAHEKRRLTREHARLVAGRDGPHAPALSVTTRHAPLLAMLRLVESVAASDAPVLITGAPGTGKARLARLIHQHAERAAAPDAPAAMLHPFATCECARWSEEALVGELFGVERGAPGLGGTRTAARAPGLLELVAGGTLHLAHVDRAPRAVQHRLAEALRTRRIPREGSGARETLPLSARLIATSTADVATTAGREGFDPALYDALTTVRVHLPPLAERVVDIPLLTTALLDELALGRAPSLTDQALERLVRYQWPGNVRELRNVLERALLLSRGGVIDADDLRLGHADGPAATPTATAAGDVVADANGRPLPLDVLERRQIVAVLEATDWHQGVAAQHLGVSAKTLYRKIREYGLSRPDGIPPRGRRPASRGAVVGTERMA
jgi:DNA-binding NtrC family response regulator